MGAPLIAICGHAQNWKLDENDFHQRLDETRCMLLVDGIDEVATKRTVNSWSPFSEVLPQENAAVSARLEILQSLALHMHAQPKGRQLQISTHHAAQAIARDCARAFRGDVAKAEAFLNEEKWSFGI
jgi:hypothetical protein